MRYQTIRKQQYDYHKDHDRSPYTWFKACFYMESASILVYLLQYSKVKPDNISILYGILGIIGGIALGTGHPTLTLIAIAIFFFKGILDWSDGHLARLKKMTSPAGADLDRFCGTIGTAFFYMGLLFYVAHRIDFYLFILLTPFFLYLRKKISFLRFIDGRARTIDTICLLVLLDIFCFVRYT